MTDGVSQDPILSPLQVVEVELESEVDHDSYNDSDLDVTTSPTQSKWTPVFSKTSSETGDEKTNDMKTD